MPRDTTPSNKSEPRRGQKQPRETRFNPKDWQGSSSRSSSISSSAAPASSSRQSPRQPPNTKAAVPSGRPERSWQDGNRNTWQDDGKPNADAVPGLDEEAGLDDWEPTGAGRKGWYNPQSSSSSAAGSRETGHVHDPQMDPQSGHGDRWRRQEAPTVSTGEAFIIAWRFGDGYVYAGICSDLQYA